MLTLFVSLNMAHTRTTSVTKDSDVFGILNSLPTNTQQTLRLCFNTSAVHHPKGGPKGGAGQDSAEFVIWIFDNLRQVDATLAYGKRFGRNALSLLLELHAMLKPYRSSIGANERVVLSMESNMIASASYVAEDMIIFMKQMEIFASEDPERYLHPETELVGFSNIYLGK